MLKKKFFLFFKLLDLNKIILNYIKNFYNKKKIYIYFNFEGNFFNFIKN